MPYFSIETNQTIDQASSRELMKKTSAFIAELLSKPESYVMIAIKPGTPPNLCRQRRTDSVCPAEEYRIAQRSLLGTFRKDLRLC